MCKGGTGEFVVVQIEARQGGKEADPGGDRAV